MAKDVIRTDQAPQFAAYSQAVRASGLVFVSGQGPYDPTSGVIVGDTIQEQTAQCLRNISAILEAGGSSLDRVVSATIIFMNPEDFAGLNEEWLKWFPGDKPARQGAKFPAYVEGLRISIAVIAEA